MCKNMVLVPLNETPDPAMKKSCKSAMFSRVWQASRRALILEHSPAHQFACCQWQRGHQPPTFYIIYRWLLFLGVLSIAVTSFACQQLSRKYKGPKVELNYFKWFIYLTNWGYVLIAVQAGFALLVLHLYRADKNFATPCDEDEPPMSLSRRSRTPWVCRVYWLTHNVATDLAFVISLVYWTLVYDPEMHEINALNVLVHGGNSVIMLCELAMTSHPIRMAHALYGAGAGFVYGIFSAFYWAVGGTDRYGLHAIYPALDWNKPGSALGFVAMCAVVLVFAHGFATCLAALRIRIALRLGPKRVYSDRMTLPTH